MPEKRQSQDASGPRTMKQSKLDFGGSSQAKKTSGYEDHNQQETPGTKSVVSRRRHNSQEPLVAHSTEVDGAADHGNDTKTSDNSGVPDNTAKLGDTVTIKVIDKIGDIFDAPPNTVIIHACNCLGNWGAGIAAAFKQRYPQAHKKHLTHCKDLSPDQLIGTAQLISPCETGDKIGKPNPKHHVGCLFTSKRFGRNRDKPDEILAATGPAMEDLLKQIKEATNAGEEIAEIRTCQINSGLFAVPWEDTKDVIGKIEVDQNTDKNHVTIVAYERE